MLALLKMSVPCLLYTLLVLADQPSLEDQHLPVQKLLGLKTFETHLCHK